MRCARWLAALATCALITVVAGCGADSPPGRSVGGARVTTSWQRDGGRTLLSVVVTPDDDDFHLYSVDHVPADHRGLGIATSLSVEGGWTSVGRPVASVAVVPVVIEELDVELPVYPNGQVEFLLEVSEVDDGGVDLVMTFGLCSDQLCLIPVRDVHIELTRP